MIKRVHALVCCGTGCSSAKSEEIAQALMDEAEKCGLSDEVEVVRSGCFGLCALGPIINIHPDNVFYSKVSPEDAREIVLEHFLKGRPVERLIFSPKDEEKLIHSLSDMDFFRKQVRVVLKNCGVINPESIDEYIALDGYSALETALTAMKPLDVVETIKASGLRGRGGGGFPTGKKWEIAASYEGDSKYVCCNADEGDPGAFMDRSVLEGDPHAVIEAMTIAGYATGAGNGVVYVRAEYPIAVKRLQIAIDQARQYGLLGENILGSGFGFDIDVRLGAGAFVCGEETALLNSVEGMRGEPRTKPPFPAEKGLWRQPTLLNNVETFANVPQIILRGVDWFRSMGTEKSPGTKVFALGGNIVNTGLVEVPMGITLREIVFDIGGGIPGGGKFKAAQTGGPSGGCIPAELIDTPIDYDSLTAIGSMMGSGGLIVMDNKNCMVDIARFFLDFTVDESCGKCTACRVGTKRLLEMLVGITKGKAREDDLGRLERLCHTIKDSSLCGLGQTAPNPVLSTLRYFRGEYESHVHRKDCPAGVCEELSRYEILPEKCKMCDVCAKNCPVTCISGVPKKTVYVIDQERCIKCGVCYKKCPFKAITTNAKAEK